MPLQALLPWCQLDLDAFFKLAIQLTSLLAELHRHEIIPKQLNPASILIHPITGDVWLSDFSLASRTLSETPVSLPLSLLPSTLAYLSPEQTQQIYLTRQHSRVAEPHRACRGIITGTSPPAGAHHSAGYSIGRRRDGP